MRNMKQFIVLLILGALLVPLVGCTTYFYRGQVTDIKEYYVGGTGFIVGDTRNDIIFDGYKVFVINHDRLLYEYKKHNFKFEIDHYYEGEFNWSFGVINSIKEITSEEKK